MTLQTLAHGARSSHAGLLATAALATLVTNRRHRVRPDTAAVTPEPTVCVLVPELSSMDAAAKNAALKLLASSTMNARVVTEGMAHKLLTDMKAGPESAAAKDVKYGAGKGTFKRFGIKKVGLGHGVTVSHHRELGNTVGLKRRGMHLALDD